ncbi:MAG: hypothetical protein EXR48_05595 [Dehalococcoidia bacterium]|nr:hypothetical protein [Dehalococcoidia bacterium]
MLVRVGSAQEAEDLTQKVFVKALRGIKEYRFQGKPFAAWLFRIAHNVVIDRHRQHKTGPELPLDDVEPISSSEDVAKEALRAIDLAQVMRAMEQLTELQRRWCSAVLSPSCRWRRRPSP